MQTYYKTNNTAVAHEAFDEETVLINFERGTYFSLRQSAPAIWNLIQSPATLGAIVACLAEAYDDMPADATAAVSAMLEELHAEGCVFKQEGICNDPLPALPAAGTFAPPLVQAFHDLQELIVLDPVHEVQEFDGWPHRPPAVPFG